MITYNTYLSKFHAIICKVVAYRRLKKEKNIKLLALRGHLWDVVAYKRFQKKLVAEERWS